VLCVIRAYVFYISNLWLSCRRMKSTGEEDGEVRTREFRLSGRWKSIMYFNILIMLKRRMKNRWRLHDFYLLWFVAIGSYWSGNEHVVVCVAPSSWFLPADGGLAVRRPLGGAQRLAHLSLSQTQRQPADLECFGEFTNLLQVDPVHLAGGGLRVYNKHTRLILLALCSSVAVLILQSERSKHRDICERDRLWAAFLFK